MIINLASSSKTRANLLKENSIKFNQIPFEYKEIKDRNLNPFKQPYFIVKDKLKQFKEVHKDLKNILVADSLVIVDNEIFGKANSDDEALYMLNKQSGNKTHIVSSMIFDGENFELLNLSIATYEFSKFDEKKLIKYVENKEYLGKAGAMSIESFNAEFIKSQMGNKSTAMGLNVEILKAYLCL